MSVSQRFLTRHECLLPVSVRLVFPKVNGDEDLYGVSKNAHGGVRRVSRSGVFLYWSIARRNLSVFRDPCALVVSVMIVLTPTSARQLARGKTTDDSRWFTPQFQRNVAVVRDVNSGPPSKISSSLIPYVTKIWRRAAKSPEAQCVASSTIVQLLYLSTATR